MDELERCILVKQEVFVYKIPPRQSSRGYRAADWNLSTPDWTGRMRVMEKNKVVILKLEDKGSNELFAASTIDKYPGSGLEAVTDSSRYFVIRITNETTHQTAFIGLGFADRSDSFDLNVALQDHFKFEKREDNILKEEEVKGPQLDLAFKVGQTIKINMNNLNKTDNEKTYKPKPRAGALLPPPSSGSILLPPPTGSSGSMGIPAPAAGASKNLAGPPSNPSTPGSSLDLLADFCDLSVVSTPVMPTAVGGGNSTSQLLQPAKQNISQANDDPWGDFASADSSSAKSSGNWVTF
jgi:hypothetical protein